jgi:hypothetical protein
MEKKAKVHVEPMILWQCVCGGPGLSKHDYQHVRTCPECETLAVAISETLNDIEKSFGRPYVGVS